MTETVVVHVIEARNLVNLDIGSLSDPYCVLSIGKTTFKSKVIQNNLNPKWDQQFTFKDVSVTSSKLVIRLYDEDFIGKDEFMGMVDLDLHAIQQSSELKDQWWHLYTEEKQKLTADQVTGDIHLQITVQ